MKMRRKLLLLLCMLTFIITNNSCLGLKKSNSLTNTADNNVKGSIDISTTVQKWTNDYGVVCAHGAAKIINTGGVPLVLGSITFVFYDNEQCVLMITESTLPIPTIVNPGEVSYASAYEELTTLRYPNQVGEVLVEIDDCFIPKQDKLELPVSNINIIPYRNPLYSFKIAGIVHNPQIKRGAIRIALAMFDKNDQLLGVYKDYPSFNAKDKIRFETGFPPIGIHNFTTKIDYVESVAEIWTVD